MRRAVVMFVACALAAVGLAQEGGDGDILIADFEGPDYGAWKVTGKAFGPGPARSRDALAPSSPSTASATAAAPAAPAAAPRSLAGKFPVRRRRRR